MAEVDPEAIFERDEWTCGICGREIERGEESIDHVVPLARGGTHEPANVQAAHRVCNARKNTKLMTELEV